MVRERGDWRDNFTQVQTNALGSGFLIFCAGLASLIIGEYALAGAVFGYLGGMGKTLAEMREHSNGETKNGKS